VQTGGTDVRAEGWTHGRRKSRIVHKLTTEIERIIEMFPFNALLKYLEKSEFKIAERNGSGFAL
jgi:hypothetical protein